MHHQRQPGSLYVVATPIGNLADMTARAVTVLNTVDLIAAEDTRHSHKLLQHYSVKTPTLSLHEHNEAARTSHLIHRLLQGDNIAVITDAGTPLISDPGYRLVTAAHVQGITVIPIPGACAAITALMAAGLPTDQFVFVGFLATKAGPRRKQLLALADESRTMIFYESVHRIVNLIFLMNEIFGGERVATIARELTKVFETIRRAPLAQLQNWLNDDLKQQKGEFVVVVAGALQKHNDCLGAQRRVLSILLGELPLKQAVALATRLTQGKRKVLYALAIELQKQVLN